MKTARLLSTYWCLLLALGACNQSDAPNPQQEQATNSDVYSAVINQNCTEQSPTRLVLVSDKTTEPFVQDWKGFVISHQQYNPQSPINQDPVWGQFISTIDSSQFSTKPIANQFKQGCNRTQLWTKELSAYYFEDQNGADWGYKELRKDFKGFGLIMTFSTVVYSADCTKAVCYASQTCDWLCGSGDIYLLEKQTTGWKVVDSVMLWIS